MAYPNYVLVYLLEVDGHWCANPKHELEWVEDADPPEYAMTSSGDFHWARLWREDLGGGNYTWRIMLSYISTSMCGGNWEFVRNVAADDPTGDYCRIVSGTKDCDAGKLGVVDND